MNDQLRHDAGFLELREVGKKNLHPFYVGIVQIEIAIVEIGDAFQHRVADQCDLRAVGSGLRRDSRAI